MKTNLMEIEQAAKQYAADYAAQYGVTDTVLLNAIRLEHFAWLINQTI